LNIPSAIPHVAAIAVIAGCAWLAQWQVERADEKRQIIENWNESDRVSLAAVEQPFDLPQPVTGVGIWDDGRQVLVDNKIRRHRPGVYVLTPLRLDDGRVFLVNRGWASWPSRSAELPDPAIVAERAGMQTNARSGASANIQGVLNTPPGTGIRLGDADVGTAEDWPLLITYFDSAALAEVFGKALQPAVVQLDPDHSAHLTGDPWQIVTFGPDRHIGYAMTWISIGLVVTAIWLVLTVRQFRKRKPFE